MDESVEREIGSPRPRLLTPEQAQDYHIKRIKKSEDANPGTLQLRQALVTFAHDYYKSLLTNAETQCSDLASNSGMIEEIDRLLCTKHSNFIVQLNKVVNKHVKEATTFSTIKIERV